MKIDWWTLALQAINFLVLVWLLWRFLYRPVREVIEKRKALAEQAFAEAEDKQEEAEAARQRFEDDRAQLAEEHQDMLKKAYEELEQERKQALEAARNDAEQLVETARASIKDERGETLAGMREEIAQLAVDLAADLLRKVGSNALDDLFLDQLNKQLGEMPKDELERLKKDLAVDGAGLTIVTAEPLAKKEQDRWITRLSSSLGKKGNPKFSTDPGIVGGAEIHFPHAVLRFTWADQLGKAKETLYRNETSR
ncbi:MAG: F0F1 ATP synthase subunit B [Alphaproteobacteria bacterium]